LKIKESYKRKKISKNREYKYKLSFIFRYVRRRKERGVNKMNQWMKFRKLQEYTEIFWWS
jgi:hypothetical protein